MSAQAKLYRTELLRRFHRGGVATEAGVPLFGLIATCVWSVPVLLTQTIGVPDVYAVCDRLAKEGVKITRAPGPLKFGTVNIAFIEDPDGYKIELVERA